LLRNEFKFAGHIAKLRPDCSDKRFVVVGQTVGLPIIKDARKCLATLREVAPLDECADDGDNEPRLRFGLAHHGERNASIGPQHHPIGSGKRVNPKVFDPIPLCQKDRFIGVLAVLRQRHEILPCKINDLARSALCGTPENGAIS
jgi:hypothetical protein